MAAVARLVGHLAPGHLDSGRAKPAGIVTPTQKRFWQRLGQRVEGLPQEFQAGRYQCPSHGGHRRDLSIRYLDGHIALKCFDGCATVEILNSLGLKVNDLYDDGPAYGKKVVEAYSYVDQHGAPLVEKVRFHPKDFRPRRQDLESGGWLWDRRGVPYVLYRLPQVLEAVQTGERIYVNEGEKAVHALERVGVVATCGWRGSSEDWTRRPEYLEALRGAYVVVVADRDEAGRKHARGVYAALRDVAAEVTLVEAATSREHADAADHLAAGFGRDDFAPLDPGEAAIPGETEAALPEVARDEGAGILDETERQYRAYVAWANDHQPVAFALWTAHTHAAEASDTTPYLSIESAEPESGKTRTLEVAEHLAARAWMLVEPSEAAMFRKIERDHPTLLLDEADALWGAKADGREGLRALLNAGYRRGATVPRVVGDGAGMTVQDFPVYGPKALAGLAGRLPRTVASRAIPIRLRRRAKGERIERFRAKRAAAELAPLRLRLAAWVKLVMAELEAADPEIPEALSDRQADCWEALLAIADAAGGDWPKRARVAAVALHEHDPAADPGTGVLLLTHVREAFADANELAITALLRALVDRDDGPWGGWWGNDVEAGKTKSPASRLAAILKPHGIKPKQLWIDGEKVRGYARTAFADVWERYLPGPTDSPDGRAVDRRSEALFDLDAENEKTASDQGTTGLPFANTVEGAPDDFDPDTQGQLKDD